MRRFVYIIVCVCLLSGCTTTKYVEVPRVHTEYVNRTDTLLRLDSVYVRDSVVVRMSGDTVYVEKTRLAYRDKLRYEVKVDSVLVTDTLTQVVRVERELTHWQRTKLRCFPWLLSFFVAVCAAVFYRLWRKFR